MDDQQRSLAERFVLLFQGNGAAYGTEEGGCVREPITWDVIEGHLFGDKPIGVYPVANGHVRWGMVDFDSPRDGTEQECFESAQRLQQALRSIGIPGFIEKTRSKGWHLWVFTPSPVLAATMRRALLAACKVAKVSDKEVNPKSETLPEGSLGNYVRLPYPSGYDAKSSPQPTSLDVPAPNWGRRCFWRNYSVDWLPLTLDEFLDEVALASPTQLELAASYWKPPAPEHEVIIHGPIGDDEDGLIAKLPGLAYTIWKEGPLPGSDRSGTLMRFCREVRAAGFSSDVAFKLVASADRRWGKYHRRPDGGVGEIEKIVRRIYQ